MQNEKTKAYVKQNPLDLGDLGFKNCAYQVCLRDEKEQHKKRLNKTNLPESFFKLSEAQ